MSEDFRVGLLKKWYLEPDDVRHHLALENCTQCGKAPGLDIDVNWMRVGCHGVWMRAKTVQGAIVLWNVEVHRARKVGHSEDIH